MKRSRFTSRALQHRVRRGVLPLGSLFVLHADYFKRPRDVLQPAGDATGHMRLGVLRQCAFVSLRHRRHYFANTLMRNMAYAVEHAVRVPAAQLFTDMPQGFVRTATGRDLLHRAVSREGIVLWLKWYGVPYETK